MMKRRIASFLWAFGVLVLLGCGLFLIQFQQDIAPPFRLRINTDGKSETIHLWQNPEGDFFAFLPSGCLLGETEIILNTQSPVQIDGTRLTDRMDCGSFPTGVPLELTYSILGKAQSRTITFHRSSQIPAMYVNTQSGNMEYIHQDRGNRESGSFRLYSPDGSFLDSVQFDVLKGRGNSTWKGREKKPYNLVLTEETDLLGMGAAQEWALMANAYDPSEMRNMVAYDLARRSGMPYAPDGRWVDLYLNGSYAGVYLLCEKIEVHPNRVDLDLQNGMLFRFNQAQSDQMLQTQSGRKIQIVYPLGLTKETIAAVQAKWQSMENAILSPEDMDPVTGKHLNDLIDVESWAMFYIIEELLGNLDGQAISLYFYCNDMDGKLYAGPLWDYDHSMGNDYRETWKVTDPNVFVTKYSYADTLGGLLWYHALAKKPAFQELVAEQFAQRFCPALDDVLTETLPEYEKMLADAAEMDRIRWYSQENVSALSKEAEKIRTYLAGHRDFLWDIWLEGETYYKIQFSGTPERLIFGVREGEPFNRLPEIADTEYQRFEGFRYSDTGEPFDTERPVTADVSGQIRWTDTKLKKMDQLGMVLPLGVIGLLGLALLIADIRRDRKREKKHGTKIPS